VNLTGTRNVVAATVGSKRMFGNSSVRLKKRYGGSWISPDTKPDEPDSRLLLIEQQRIARQVPTRGDD